MTPEITIQYMRQRAARAADFARRLDPLLKRQAEIDAEIGVLTAEMRLDGVSNRDIKSLRRAIQLGLRQQRDATVARILRDGSKRPEPDGKIYILRCHATSLIKIGFSEHVSARIASIRRQSSTEISIVLIVEGGAAEEAELHRRFAASRHHNEWFAETPELLTEVERLRTAGRANASPLLSWGAKAASSEDLRIPESSRREKSGGDDENTAAEA